jgi:hypothetical protein
LLIVDVGLALWKSTTTITFTVMMPEGAVPLSVKDAVPSWAFAAVVDWV